jgi:transcriptional regulator with XRE-family HTH domain
MLPADKLLLERVGARLRELRLSAKLTQETVGERAGFSGKYIGEIEKGVRDVPLSTLRAVVEHGLGLHIEAALGGRAARYESHTTAIHPRDVEMTAALLAELPLAVRRPLSALAREVSYLVTPMPATRAAESVRTPRTRRAR